MRGTGQCNGGVVEDYRESDIPHHYKNTGMFTHEYYDDNYSTALFFQMHGMSERSDTSIRAIVSDGTDYDSSDTGSIANDLRTALDSQLPSGYVAKSCQGTTLGSSDRLCGTDNLWGRYTNGGTHSNACTTSQSTSSDRFLHVEQTWDLQSPADDEHQRRLHRHAQGHRFDHLLPQPGWRHRRLDRKLWSVQQHRADRVELPLRLSGGRSRACSPCE